ncbi:MAG: hypothetical protein FD123_2757 [Bacteroidetes bacterium]|nr:MAG: hypothetical protein FD123_2757 [Bacteroidota bacterium]
MITKETAYKKIAELVERFEEQFASYKKSEYNETLTRRDFIDPFFKALGWDIDNEQGYAEAYREVIHEDRIKIGGATKAPDYSFRLVGGKRLFFVEAKKPSVAVKEEIQPAYQVRRYGWSAKLPISIITDFEEFAIYDCTKKPKPTDKAAVARIKYLTFREYLQEFEFIWNTFSKERVLKGSFDTFVQSDTHKKGTATVDKDFLQSLDSWRTQLAKAISSSNKDLDEDEINFAVQQLIDRIIFLRIAEDRSVEPYGNMQGALKSGDYYHNLFDLFREADEKYNSGLFDFKKDQISKHLKIDNKIIKNVINELYYPESPYEFSVLSVEILGSAYEQFLGKQIKIDKAHHVKIEEKPEVRKAGGVYYTPQYVVDYIVKNTVGKLIEGKTPKDISKIKIVDPSCGSGSFLIGAYQYLLDWHKDYYSNKGKPVKGKKDNPLTPDGNLTTGEKKRILLNNIFGVDIDVNAVEVTKLSLLLKCMEGETSASINNQLKFFNERVLPTLDENIKSGNSLIDTDFYETQLDFGEEKNIKPFNWQKGFPTVFQEGGFNIILGNPPWGANLSNDSIIYLKKKHHSIIVRMIDSYMYFINHSINILNKEGYLGMIIPSTFLNQVDMKLLRKKIIETSNINSVINLGEKIFGSKVLNTSTILIFQNTKKSDNKILLGDIRNINLEEKAKHLNELNASNKKEWIDLVKTDEQTTFFTFSTLNVSLLSKLRSKHPKFKDILDGEVQRGVSPDYAKAVILTKDEAKTKKIETSILKPLVLGKHITRYTKPNSDVLLIYLTSKDDLENYTNAKKHLLQYKKFITCREVAEGKHKWYSLHRPRNPDIFKKNKFIGLTTTKKLCLIYDEFGYYTTDALYVFNVKKGVHENSVLAVFNSKAFQFLYETAIQGGQRVIPQVKAANLYELPFPNATKKNLDLEKLTEQLLELNQRNKEIKLDSKRQEIKSKIDYCESRINEIVYQLYELTPDEIKIVEEASK